MSMNANDPNLVLLEIVAQHLGADLLESLVFVGGGFVDYRPCDA